MRLLKQFIAFCMHQIEIIVARGAILLEKVDFNSIFINK